MNTTKIPTPILTIFLQTVVYFTHFGDKYQLYFFIIFLVSLINKELLRNKQGGP